MRKITIIGAGLVGSLWAYLMKKRGYEVEIFEKRPDPRLLAQQAGRSINLVVTSRGLHGLEKAGLLKQILPITVPVYGRQVHPKNGDSFFQPYGRDNSECNYSVSRWELNKSLIEECLKIGVKIYFDHEIESINFEKKEMKFKSMHSIRLNYDLLFATDGAGSNVRKSLIAQFPNDFSESLDWLSSSYKELFMPALTENTSRIARNALHIWPRGSHMLMGLANLDGSFTMTLYLPNTNHECSFEATQTDTQIKNLFDTEFRSAKDFMPDYLNDFKNNPQGALGTVRMSKWFYKDSVALMGDAAHAIVPFFGQGMNLGFEDCTELLSCLENANEDWSMALSNYDRIQRPNANAIADMALENFIEMRDKVSDPQFQLRKKIEAVIEKEFPQLYRSRYGLITYTLVPYAVAKEAGIRQSKILDQLAEGLTDTAQVDMNHARILVENEFINWFKNLGFRTESYRAHC